VADDRHPLALADAELVEPGLHGPAAAGHFAVGQLTQRRRGLLGLVDDADPVSVDQLAAVEEVATGERDAHAGSRGAPTGSAGRSTWSPSR